MLDFNDTLARVTVRDVLKSFGIEAACGRIPCPIHGGKNQTAFSINEHTFCCFSCGASGGLIQLTMHLRDCDRNGALKYLCQLAGLPFTEPKRRNSKAPKRAIPTSRPIPDRPEYQEAKQEYERLLKWQGDLESQLRFIKKSHAFGYISVPVFVAKKNHILAQLQELDEEIPAAKWDMNQVRKKGRKEA